MTGRDGLPKENQFSEGSTLNYEEPHQESVTIYFESPSFGVKERGTHPTEIRYKIFQRSLGTTLTRDEWVSPLDELLCIK